MNFFKKKIILNPLHKEDPEKDRRSFIRKSIAALFGAVILTKAEDVFSLESKTGFKYVKRNGEVINNYKPSGDSQPYLGQITIFGTYYAPQPQWMRCEGQIINITDNTALFSLLGTYYGGDGKTTFALPDFRGRVAIGAGQGSGLSNYEIGQTGGTASVALLQHQMPLHNHSVAVSSGIGTTPNPSGSYIAQNAEGIDAYSASSNALLNAGALAISGSGMPHNNLQPILVMNYCIAVQGIFPSR